MGPHELQKLIDNRKFRNRVSLAFAFLATSAVALFLVLSYRGSLLPQEVVEVAPPSPDAYAGIALSAKAALAYDLATGEVLYARNADMQLPLASLTKLLTMYAASAALAPNDTVSITEDALKEDGDSGFMAGESFAFAELAKIALVGSSNDATKAIADRAAGERATSGTTLLASAVAAVGLTETYALNGTGLDVSEKVSGGYGSARDIAVLAGALLKEAPLLAAATTKTSSTIISREGKTHQLKNTNQQVTQVPGILLSKTGYTDLAGGNLVVVYDAGVGHPVALVVLGSTQDARFTDIQELLARTSLHFAGLAPL